MTEREKIIDILNKNFTQEVECTPVYTATDGKELALPQELCNIFNDIVTQAVIPYFADALIEAGLKFDAIPEWEYQGIAPKIIEPQIKGCFDRERALKGQLAVVYRALLNMTKKYCVAERKIATTKDGWFSRGETQLALLAAEAIRDAEKELAEEKKDE